MTILELIIANAALATGLLAVLVHVMRHAAKLEPHRHAVQTQHVPPSRPLDRHVRVRQAGESRPRTVANLSR